MREQWLPIPNWERAYEVSDQGRVRSLGVAVRARGGSLAFRPGRVLAGVVKRPSGRVQVSLSRGPSDRVSAQVSVLVARAFLGTPPKGAVVAHRNDNSADNRLRNLYYATPAENYRDSLRNGGRRLKISLRDARAIVATLGFETASSVAQRFGLSRHYVNKIRSTKRWAGHVL